MSVYIGVDGGGTRARAVVVDAEGRELARYTGGAGIVDPREPAGAARVVAAVARAAMSESGIAPPAAVLCCGLAVGSPGTELEFAL